MDDKHDEKDSVVDTKKVQAKPIPIPKVLQPTLHTLSEPSKLKQWYFNYIMSDFTFASISTAILAMIKLYFNIPFDKFVEGLAIWYLIYVATMVARLTKVFSTYYEEKTKRGL